MDVGIWIMFLINIDMDILIIFFLFNLIVMVIIGVFWLMLCNKCKEWEVWNK